MALRTLAHAVDVAARRAPMSLALLAPQQAVAKTYGELRRDTRAIARALANWGVRRNDIIASDLPNTAENFLLQLAAARLGAAMATVKDQNALESLCTTMQADGRRVCGAATVDAASFLAGNASLPLPSAVVGGTLESILSATTESADDAETESADADGHPEQALGFWNSTKAMTHQEALKLGSAAAKHLSMTAADRVAVSITLCHAFGIGSACGSALVSGAAVVLPAVGGLRGCGVPSQRASVTLEVLASQRCSVLFADTHTLKALNDPTLDASRAAADLSSLRTGVVKVGSGTDFLDETVDFAGVPLVTLGKRS